MADQVTVKLNKTLYIDLQPFEKPRYINIISKSYRVRVAPNASSKALALVSLAFVQKFLRKRSSYIYIYIYIYIYVYIFKRDIY